MPKGLVLHTAGAQITTVRMGVWKRILTFLIDNTPPVIGDIRTETKGGAAHIRASIVDRTTTVASFEYSVDSTGDWQAVLPSDNIFDGPEEKVDFTISKLAPGAHQITLRAGDAKGNHGFETVFVNVDAQAGK